jgi:DtxR family Mn-dependent transcriptional regulator
MSDSPPTKSLTASLEDYLETIYLLGGERKVARIRDIASARNVKAGSVTPAMKRLAELGYITYSRREYITLTAAGEHAARRILSRHQILTSFLRDVLQMHDVAAEHDACALEHHLSDDAMDRIVRFFEFMRTCPGSAPGFLERFHHCPQIHADQHGSCSGPCPLCAPGDQQGTATMTLADLKPGQSARVRQVNASGAIRQRLLDMGILPDAEVRVERIAFAGDPIWIKLKGYQLSLRTNEARAVLIAQG